MRLHQLHEAKVRMADIKRLLVEASLNGYETGLGSWTSQSNPYGFYSAGVLAKSPKAWQRYSVTFPNLGEMLYTANGVLITPSWHSVTDYLAYHTNMNHRPCRECQRQCNLKCTCGWVCQECRDKLRAGPPAAEPEKIVDIFSADPSDEWGETPGCPRCRQFGNEASIVIVYEKWLPMSLEEMLGLIAAKADSLEETARQIAKLWSKGGPLIRA